MLNIRFAPQTVRFYSADEAPEQSRFQSVTNVGFVKPQGGLWTSPPEGESWLDWCRGENWGGWEQFVEYELKPNPEAILAVIDGKDDFQRLLDRYSIQSPYLGAVLDFEAMATEFDGIWMTDNGQWETRLLQGPSLYGWDLPSILWFRWMFD